MPDVAPLETRWSSTEVERWAAETAAAAHWRLEAVRHGRLNADPRLRLFLEAIVEAAGPEAGRSAC